MSELLFHSFALSAWKAAGASKWSLRCNPSSGNLHPTEVYLLAPPIQELSDRPGLYHYTPRFHALELRAHLPHGSWSRLVNPLPPSTLLFGFTSIHWRESWKYGERALRYCLLDLGHAFAALCYAAACLGWHCTLLPVVDRTALARLLGTAGQQGPEAEHPDCLAAVFPGEAADRPAVSDWRIGLDILKEMEEVMRDDPPNHLSPNHRSWPIIAQTAEAIDTEIIEFTSSPPIPEDIADIRPVGARWLIRHRRSALAMDGKSVMTRTDFLRLLHRLCRTGLPIAGLGHPPAVHPVFFIHRVEGVAPGLYFLARSDTGLTQFRQTSATDWQWTRPWPELPFYRLGTGDTRAIAKTLSCHQDIASGGAFALAMLAELERCLKRDPWEYVRLHMEAGALGQLLYLEAEACNMRGTGIGCFFDDPVHELLGIGDLKLQVIYHFTVGGALEDPRLLTLDAYHHLQQDEFPH